MNLRLAQLDKILVCGTRVQAPDVQVCFAQLVPTATSTTWPTAAAVVVAAATGTWGCHLLGH